MTRLEPHDQLLVDVVARLLASSAAERRVELVAMTQQLEEPRRKHLAPLLEAQHAHQEARPRPRPRVPLQVQRLRRLEKGRAALLEDVLLLGRHPVDGASNAWRAEPVIEARQMSSGVRPRRPIPNGILDDLFRSHMRLEAEVEGTVAR